MTQIEELKRRILIKKQLIQWTQEDIGALEKKMAELESTMPEMETPAGKEPIESIYRPDTVGSTKLPNQEEDVGFQPNFHD